MDRLAGRPRMPEQRHERRAKSSFKIKDFFHNGIGFSYIATQHRDPAGSGQVFTGRVRR
jgi:hypothetical protein